MQLSTLQQIAIWVLPVLFAITVHEVAHGWVASKLGDKTALIMGRVTLNPLKHIDLVGTILVPAVLLILGGFVFGWAKPVPVNFSNLRKPRRDMALVAAAGPASNFMMLIAWGLIGKIGAILFFGGMHWAQALMFMGYAGISINMVLMILNLIPIPPLDGSRIVSSFLPPKVAMKYNMLERYGIFIILALLFIGGNFYSPMVLKLFNLIRTIFGF